MKKMLLMLVLSTGIKCSFAQSLTKDNLMGFHVVSVALKPHVTMDQFRSFYLSQVIPAYEKALGGARLYLVKGVRGEHANNFGIIYHFTSEAERNKYFNEDGSPTADGKKAVEQVTAVDQELEKYGTYTTKYTDWVVQ